MRLRFAIRQRPPRIHALAALALFALLESGCRGGAAGDRSPPRVVAAAPAPGATRVSLDTPIEVSFSEPVTAIRIEVSPELSLAREEESDATRVRFVPEGPLTRGRTYTATLAAADLAGNAIDPPYRWTFTTADAPTDDTCAFSRDGACDEPVNCTLGTDSADCETACAAADGLAFHAAACAYRVAPGGALPAPGPGSGGSLHVTGHRDGTLRVPSGADATAQIDRHYRLYVPSTYDPARPSPLVLMLPGNRADIYSLADFTQLARTAEMNRFLVAYVEQEWRWDSFAWSWWTDWDWGSQRVHPDVLFLGRLVERLSTEYNVDRTRVFAVGHSRGAAMAMIAAFELPHLFAGACIQSGFTEFGYHRRLEAFGGRKIPLVFVHGAQDNDVCIDCAPGGTCGVDRRRACGSAAASDALVAILRRKGWTDDTLVYHRLENVAHRWQPQLNDSWWEFLATRPLPHEALP